MGQAPSYPSRIIAGGRLGLSAKEAQRLTPRWRTHAGRGGRTGVRFGRSVGYREGRQSLDELAQRCGLRSSDLLPILERLEQQRRVELLDDGRYRAQCFAVPWISSIDDSGQRHGHSTITSPVTVSA